MLTFSLYPNPHNQETSLKLHEFKWVKSFSVLEPDPKTRGNSPKMDSKQNLDGNCLVEKRRCQRGKSSLTFHEMTPSKNYQYHSGW